MLGEPFGTSSDFENLTPRQQEQLRERLEEGFFLRQSRGAFNFFAHRGDWDAAVILDACRFDTFADALGRPGALQGTLEERISPGSCTEDWLAECLEGDLSDVVYISASPYISRWYFEQAGIDVRLAHLEEVWRSGWDDGLHTVPPAAVTAAYRRLAGLFAGAKFVLHYMQPHQPFIGAARVPGAGWRAYFGAMELDVPQLEGKTAMEMLEDGEATREVVYAAYRANLDLVLGEVAGLLPQLPQRVVITADHGECFGECGIFGHPPGLTMPELIRVPYFRLDVQA